MKRFLLYSCNNAKSISGNLVLAFIMAFLTLGSIQKANAQCVIEPAVCPTSPIVACANQTINGVEGATLSWTAPDFKLTCGSTSSGYDWVMNFDLPESNNWCWAFNLVQRTGTQGGILVLNQSTGSGLPSFFTPPFIVSSTVNCAMNVYADQNFIMRVYYIDANGGTAGNRLLPAAATVSVSGTGAKTITFQLAAPPSSKKYRLYFEFEGLTNNKSSIDNLSVDALVDGETCLGDINFYTTVTTTNGVTVNPTGTFFPVGTDQITYTAYYNIATKGGEPTISDTETCTFDIIVNGVNAEAVITPASCDLNNGSFVLTAASTPSLPSYEYSLNAGTTWIPFVTPVNINGLDDGTYGVNVRGNFPIGGECDLISNVSAVVSRIVDNTPPSITCALSDQENITRVINNDGSYTVLTSEFDATADDNCSVASIVNDLNNTATLAGAILAVGVHEIVWTAIDNAGNQSTCTSTITVLGEPSFSVVKNDVTCYEAGNGIITITPISGLAPFTYSINNGVDYYTTPEFTSLRPGTYMIRVKDANGIESPLCQ